MNIEIPDRLIQDRRSLDSLPNVQIINDVNWDNYCEKWYLKISIEIEKKSEYIPQKTNWFVVAESVYPYGKIKVYPDIENSLDVTFQHQGNNSEVEKNGLWRKGSLCLDLDIAALGIATVQDENNRILWNVKRTVLWLKAASTNSLVSNTSLFEFPEYLYAKPLEELFVFTEDIVSFMQWESRDEKYGLAWLDVYKSNPFIYYIKSFNSIKDVVIRQVEWGHFLEDKHLDKAIKAVWIRLDNVPVLNIWQPPRTYEELEYVFVQQGYNLEDFLDSLSPQLRDGKRHLLLLGYPVPQYFYGEDDIITWQAMELPHLSYGKKTAKGFRNNENGWRMRDKQEVFKKTMQLDWMESQNWNLSQISQRGKLNQEVVRKNILIIGAGCIGSVVSELLVRSGSYNITILDGDLLVVGNLCRHTLGLIDIGGSKAKLLSERLNSINPHARIKNSISMIFNTEQPEVDLSCYDLVIDCSGSNKVLAALKTHITKKSATVASISLSLEAHYIYLGLWKSNALGTSLFFENIAEFLEKDKQKYKEIDLPRNGIGCWHPTFPARIDDVWSAASIAVRAIETFVTEDRENEVTLVYEKTYENQYFDGYRIKKRCNK